jgi:hypothetical protein
MYGNESSGQALIVYLFWKASMEGVQTPKYGDDFVSLGREIKANHVWQIFEMQTGQCSDETL